METNQDPEIITPEGRYNRAKPVIEELKAVGEELKETPPDFPKATMSPLPPRKVFSPEKKEEKTKIAEAEKEEKVSLFKKMAEYQKELSQEQSVLERSYQKIKELEKILEQRIELLKRLQQKSSQISKELKEFQEQWGSVKKDNSNLLEEIKNKLKSENE